MLKRVKETRKPNKSRVTAKLSDWVYFTYDGNKEEMGEGDKLDSPISPAM